MVALLEAGLVLLLGGARSGKSDLAVQMGEAWTGPVTFAATAEAGDDDMANRIASHQHQRPDTWNLTEAPTFSGNDLNEVPTDHLVIVDCITVLVSNLLVAQDDAGETNDAAILDHLAHLGQIASDRENPTIVVTNEVGLGVHPATRLGSRYRDLLGRVNVGLTQRASHPFVVLAGRPLPLDHHELSWG